MSSPTPIPYTEIRCDNPVQLALAKIMDPVAFDPRAVATNLGQDWDRTERQMTALCHAENVIDAGWSPPRGRII